MRLRLSLFLAMVLLSPALFPCGNSYRRSPNTVDYVKGSRLESFTFKKKFDQSVLVEELTKLVDAISADLNLFENKNDQALAYMRMGKYTEAISILEALEKERPGEYNIIANLGTAYELNGENKRALVYIKKALALNAGSHRGSEWFHVRILEAKLQGKEPRWWLSHPVLNLATVPKDPETLIGDIVYQLKERIPFTSKPDILMTAVLRETGDYLVKQEKLQQAWVIYRIASEYYDGAETGIADKIGKLEKKLAGMNIPLPDYKDHFTGTDDLIEKGKNLLEKGIDLYNQQEEKKAEEKKTRNKRQTQLIAVFAGVACLAGLFVFLGMRKKRME